jgi:peptide-methionine (R)-S-oxide reductase
MLRRHFLSLISLSALSAATGFPVLAETITPLTLTDAQWKARLPPASYNVMRQEGTETAFTSPLLNEHRKGTFVCLGCDLPLFLSQSKYDSGTGWPSFFRAIAGHIKTKDDMTFDMERTEYHCVKCGSHQGHVFEDGPPPTGQRYCNNGVALKFVPA